MGENKSVTREYIRLVLKDLLLEAKSQADVVSNVKAATAQITVLGPIETVTGGMVLAGDKSLDWAARTRIFAPAAGELNLRNVANTAYATLRVSNLVVGTTGGGVNIGPSGGDAYIAVKSDAPAIELVASWAEGAGAAAGLIDFINTSQTGGVRMAAIFVETEGTTATNRGGRLGFFTKPDAGSLTRRMTITQAGDVGIGTSTPEAYDGGNMSVRRITVFNSSTLQAMLNLGVSMSGT